MFINIVIMLVIIGLIVGLVIVRGNSGGKYDVKPTDAIIAATLLFLWLFISGQVDKLIIGSSGVTVETADAILNASKAKIGDAVSEIPLGDVDRASRNASSSIDKVVNDEAEAIEYVLGSDYYTAADIEEELSVLTQHIFFRYVILTHENGSFFGVLDAHKLVRILPRKPGPYSWEDFTEQVNSGDTESLNLLKGIPSFTGVDMAVTPEIEKREVLRKMQTSYQNWLPVVSSDYRFLGVVSRTQLMASMILDIGDQLETESK